MGKFKDITGIRFGKLTVIKRGKNYISPKGLPVPMWECLCDCGNKTTVRGSSLKTGRTKSCGCLLGKHLKRLEGKKFGKWIVLKRAKNHITPSGQPIIRFWCRCDCGLEKRVMATHLKNGLSRSCGQCKRIKKGDKIGKLTIISKKKGERKWLCKCECGKEIFVSDIHLKHRLPTKYPRSCGCAVKSYAVYSEFFKKTGHKIRRAPENQDYLQVKCKFCKTWFTPNTNQCIHRKRCLEGITIGESNFYCSNKCKKACPVYGKVEFSDEEIKYRQATAHIGKGRPVQGELRKLCFDRDQYQCQICGRAKDLVCHHYEGIQQNPIESADIDNCITLCRSCHVEKAHSSSGCHPINMKCNPEDLSKSSARAIQMSIEAT